MNNPQLFFTAREIKEKNPLVEQHLHSNFSDGENSPKEIIDYAIKKKIWRIAFTEHVWRSSDWYDDYIVEMVDLQEKYKNKITILTGLEAKLINLKGEIDATPKQVSKAKIIIGSVHGYCKKGDCQFYEMGDLKAKEAVKMELACILKLIKNAKNSGINVIGHPFGAYLESFSDPIPVSLWERVIKEISAKQLAFDLNYRYHQTSIGIILKLCEKYRTKINIGSDVHCLSDIGKISEFIEKLNY